MSIDNNEERNLSLPDVPPGHPANAGAIDWGESLPVAPIAAAKAKADWEAAKERAVQSEPSTRAPAGLARHDGLKDQRTAAKAATQEQAANTASAAGQVADAAGTAPAGDATHPAAKVRKARTTKAKDQAPDAADGAQQADPIVKPPRKSRAAAKAAATDAQVQPAGAVAVKPARSRRQAATKAAETNEQGKPAVGSAPAIKGVDIPPITPEAITFLSDPDAKAADLFKLQPESQAFVQYHITNMQRLEAASALGYSYLMSQTPKYSPAFEKVADALMAKLDKDRRTGVKPVFTPTRPVATHVSGAFYGARQTQVDTYQAIPIHLGKMEIGPSKNPAQEQEASVVLAAADIQRAHRVIGTAHAMMSSPIGDVTREVAADLVAGDLDDIRVIKDERARQVALNAMIESSHAQPHYKGEFERLAPELVAPALEASAAMEVERAARELASRSVSKAGEQDAENTIEPGIAPERENQPAKDLQQSSPSADPAVPGVTQSAPTSAIGRRMLRAMGAWLQGKAQEKPAPAPAPGAKPAQLDKQAAPAMADDKANLVPEAVARRFLKVERDYYFPDKTLAFSDRGNKLATRGAQPEVVRSLIEIAQARGWDSITVKGTDEFRRSAWMEATQAGLKVAGYKPTALDLAELASKPATNTVEKGLAKERDAAATQQSATQQSKAGAAAQAKAADPAPSPELAAKARAFEKEKPGFVIKKFPELAQAYGVVDAAKKFAEANLSQDVREEFVSLARRHVMQKILTGEQVKGPQIYAAPAKTKEVTEQTQAPAQAAVDQGKSARSKEVARER